MRQIDHIVVHCTAGSQKQTAADVIRYHTSKEPGCLGWNVPGYHYIINPDGTIVNAVPIEQISNGVRGKNSNIINVAYIGGVDVTKKGLPAVDNRTPAQKRALRSLLKELKGKFTSADILGHRDLASEDKNHNGIIDPWERCKECPCFDAIPEYADL